MKNSFTLTAASLSVLLPSLVNAGIGGSGNEMGLGGAGANLMGKTMPLKQPLNIKLSSKTFKCSKSWQGSSFFDGWDFFYWQDPTNGMVNYQNTGPAWDKQLISISDSGTALMKVDAWTWLGQGQYRDSIRITSQTPFRKGNLLVLDAKHMPYGCGTWPAFWTVGANWPYGGEIDIIEGVNNQNTNQMTLHTAPGCEIQKDSSFAGSVLQESCDAFYNYNTGCGIRDTSTKSYGKRYNAEGGGVHATLWDDDGIYVWFFSRNNIPSDLSSGSPKPANWGKPRAWFKTDNCAMDDFFGDQTIVFDTTLCGDWAGATYGPNGCPGTCQDRVTNPNNFAEAYWEINYVKIFN